MKIMDCHDRAAGLRLFERWLRQVGVSRTTGWRWRRDGWLKTENIAGKVYVAEDEIEQFTRRVKAGEFAKMPKVPTRNRGDTSTLSSQPTGMDTGKVMHN